MKILKSPGASPVEILVGVTLWACVASLGLMTACGSSKSKKEAPPPAADGGLTKGKPVPEKKDVPKGRGGTTAPQAPTTPMRGELLGLGTVGSETRLKVFSWMSPSEGCAKVFDASVSEVAKTSSLALLYEKALQVNGLRLNDDARSSLPTETKLSLMANTAGLAQFDVWEFEVEKIAAAGLKKALTEKGVAAVTADERCANTALDPAGVSLVRNLFVDTLTDASSLSDNYALKLRPSAGEGTRSDLQVTYKHGVDAFWEMRAGFALEENETAGFPDKVKIALHDTRTDQLITLWREVPKADLTSSLVLRYEDPKIVRRIFSAQAALRVVVDGTDPAGRPQFAPVRHFDVGELCLKTVAAGRDALFFIDLSDDKVSCAKTKTLTD